MIDYAIAIMSAQPGTKKAEITETKAYGTAQVREVLNLDQFCQHVADHNSPFSKGTIKGVLEDAVSCLREQILAGNNSNIKEVNTRWCPGKDFKNLRAEATFNLVPTRKAQADAVEEIKNEETIHGLE